MARRRSRSPLAVTAVVAVLVATACRGGGATPDDAAPPPTEATTTVAAPETTTTTAAPSYGLPAVIDAAYLESVMAAIDRAHGDAARLLARERQLTREFLAHLEAIYTDSELDFAVRAWTRNVDDGLPNLPAVPTDPRTQVQAVVTASTECVVMKVERDTSGFTTVPPPPRPQRYVALVPRPVGRDSLGVNPTPWYMAFDGYMLDGSEPEEPCDPA